MARAKIKVQVNGTSTDYFVNAGTYASSLGRDSEFKENFSLGSNIQILVNGSADDAVLRSGDVITVRQVASSKAAATVKVKVNVNGTSSDYFAPSGSTASTLSRNAQFREDFTLGSNIEVLVNGVGSGSTRLRAGDVITVRQVASSKAV